MHHKPLHCSLPRLVWYLRRSLCFEWAGGAMTLCQSAAHSTVADDACEATGSMLNLCDGSLTAAVQARMCYRQVDSMAEVRFQGTRRRTI